MRFIYSVPAGATCEELDIMGAKPGDLIVVRPSHPTAPLAIVRNFGHGILPIILSAAEHLAPVEVPADPADALDAHLLPPVARRRRLQLVP